MFISAQEINRPRQPLVEKPERIENVGKSFNQIHRGSSGARNVLLMFFTDEPIQSGRYKGDRLDAPRWLEILDQFHEMHEKTYEAGGQVSHGLLRSGLRAMWQKFEEFNGISFGMYFFSESGNCQRCMASIRELIS